MLVSKNASVPRMGVEPVGLTSAELAAKTREGLRTLPVIAEKLREAERQLDGYREVLERGDGGSLEPRTHALACIGLERLVW